MERKRFKKKNRNVDRERREGSNRDRGLYVEIWTDILKLPFWDVG